MFLRKTSWLLYGFIVAAATVVFFVKSNANWDMIAYTACIQQMENREASAADIHWNTYEIVKKETSAKAYEALVDSSNPYRIKALANVNFFQEQLMFYKVKPGYTLLNLIFKKITGSYRKGIALSGVLGWVIVAVLLPLWFKKSLPATWVFPVSLFILFLPDMFTAARMAAPDMISSAIVIWACYAIFQQRHGLAMILLILSVFFRPDNNIYAGFFLAFIWLENKNRLIRIQALVSLLLVVVTTLWIMSLAGGGSTLSALFSGSYFTRIAEGLRTIPESFLPLIFVFTGILFAGGVFSIREKTGRFALLILLIACTKFLLIPSLENRFFIPLILAHLVLGATAVSEKVAIKQDHYE